MRVLGEFSLLLLFWVTAVRGSDSLLSPKGVNYEVAALMSMKNKMIDEDHVLDGWDINSVDPCTWNMVACSPDGFVISLEMGSVGLSGTLSPSIGNLSHLQAMRLSKNKLSGEIPTAVANLTGLSFLDLSFNNLSGPVPKILAKDYSITGNSLLCSSLSKLTCMGVTTPANGVCCTMLVLIMLLVFGVHWYRSRLLFPSYVQQDYEFDIGHLKRFSFRELQIATSNFSPKNILGQGGFGVVYKGYLPNRTVVAVKRMKDPNFTGETQFQTEVEMIGLALHRNLLRLYGFCMTANEKLLVYPYMPNGSVADRLRGLFSSALHCVPTLDTCQEKPSLDWDKRMHIALGAARGLVYLHEQCNPKIIHRDVKAANILLDESFEAVVGDFGLAKLLDLRDTHVTTAVRGTVGHIAPEYLLTGQSSEKSDVFGFGILLLELITGQKALDAGNGHVQKGMILERVRTLHADKRLDVLVDRDLKGCFKSDELEKAVEVALHCTRPNPNFRPKMSDVFKVLESIAGKAGHTEESQGVKNSCDGQTCSFSQNYGTVREESSFIVESIELSGPR
ncbi:hypothetical protein C3L33_06140, partial [Rhododendron williamsianum]